MPNLQTLLRAARDELAGAGLDDPMTDARLLLMEAGEFTRADLIANGSDDAPKSIIDKFSAALKRRVNHEPIAYILGYKEFWAHKFHVSKDVLVPRPETEGVVEQALKLACKPDVKILDIGTGSGAILISLLQELEHAQGLGVDISLDALKVAAHNARALEVDMRCEFRCSNFLENVSELYDLIVSNPPYIDATHMEALPKTVKDYEPGLALAGGCDGLSAYKTIIADLPEALNSGGHIIFEIGYDQAAPVSALLAENGFQEIICLQDLAGHDRVLSAKISA